jgi:adenine-specific DNA-methyltransferase
MPSKKKNDSATPPLEQYTHKDKQRANNPPVGLVTPDTDQEAGRKTYAYDPHLDPQLTWAGKAEHTSFEVPTVSLHVHERIDPRTIIEAVRKPQDSAPQAEQLSLFATKQENPPLREAIEFYKHRHNWTNRLIAGDSLLVMNSLLEKEGLAGHVQMVYLDPPYGIRYGSNFQPFVNKRDVKDGRDEDLTQEPETIRAFRDTWELGIHSYLTYLRDRLLLARELLHESGSIFVQISDENVHLVRNLMDEVFGANNFAALVSFSKAAGGLRAANRVGVTLDYLAWYFKNNAEAKYRPLYEKKGDAIEAGYNLIELNDGSRRSMTKEERQKQVPLPEGAKPYMTVLMTKPGPGSKYEVEYSGKMYDSGKRWWGTTPEGIQSVIKAKRVAATETSLRFITYFNDFPYRAYTNLWSGLGGAADPVYVVQTNPEVIQRCLLMTTDPGDLVFDPTCGSGTTAYVAEQWGRRWITCDTSRVAVTLARQRLMTALFDYYQLAQPEEGVGSGFRYKTVPHVTLKSIANNEPPAQETLYDQPLVDSSKLRVTGPFTVEPKSTVKD